MNSVINFVNAPEVNQKLSSPCQLIDVRDSDEFQSGHISGSQLMPLSELDNLWDEINGNVPIYLICKTGVRSANAAEKLSQHGFNNINVLKGGLVAWKKAGLPLQEQKIWSMDRQVRFTAGILILIGISLSFANSPFWIYMSAFVALGMVLSAITDSCGMALILAKMPWNYAEKSDCAKRCQNQLMR